MANEYLRETLNRRARSLATMRPFYDLEGNKGLIQAVALESFDLFRLSAAVLDIIITEMGGFRRGASYEQILQGVLPLMRRIVPDLTDSAADRVVSHVLDNLCNEKDKDCFRTRYQYEEADGAVHWAPLHFKLLEERDVTGDGQYRYVAKPEAINVFVSSLGVDIEAEQAANEAVVRHFMKHGRHKDAGIAAKAALDRSIEYKSRMLAFLQTVERNAFEVDYLREIAPLLARCREHLGERLTAEADLLLLVEDQLPETAQTDRPHLLRVRETIRRAMNQHDELINIVTSANHRILEEHSHQKYRRAGPVRYPDPLREVIRPMLLLPVGDLDDWFTTHRYLLFPPTVPRLADFSALSAALTQDPPASDDLSAVIPEGTLVPESTIPIFTEEDGQRVRELLESIAVPFRLSNAIAASRTAGHPESVTHLLVLNLTQWFGEAADIKLRVTTDGSLPEDDSLFYGNDLVFDRPHVAAS